eukprot:TRINITY_DN19768_c0_g1_i1.p1 TRINITY_DN19768_c0_g1~~TRINITY_DN19768_c0_g1_i1.p1  ORF type:complete len:301 (+),score=88.49 TRINITY_DN19768_c0_g1_i1:110-1012(+)
MAGIPPAETDGGSESTAILLLLLGLTFLAPLGAAFFAQKVTDRNIISLLNTAAAGVFFGITFFHIIPESFGGIYPANTNLPPAEAGAAALRTQASLLLAGFCAMLALDKIVFRNHGHAHHVHEPSGDDVPLQSIDAHTPESIEADPEKDDEHHRRKRNIAISTLVTFSCHSLLEGLAIGAEKPDLQILGLIIVFSFHKAMDGLAVTVPLARVFSLRTYWVVVVAFATTTPTGILISSLLLQQGPLSHITGYVEAFSGGIFLTISLYHIVAEQMENPHKIRSKVALFSAAVVMMFFLEMID